MAHVRISNPWSDFNHLQAHMERLFDAQPRTSAREQRVTFTPAVDVHELEESYRIDLDLPGVQRDAVSIEVVDGVLMVRGERPRPEHGEGSSHRVERRFGSFERAFRLPKDVDADGIVARAADGVLTLTLAKKPEAQPRRIEIQA